jgi:hypothetical protein
MNDTLEETLAGTPLLPGHAAPLNATDPNGERITAHLRSSGNHRYTTVPITCLSSHRCYVDWTVKACRGHDVYSQNFFACEVLHRVRRIAALTFPLAARKRLPKGGIRYALP